MLSRWPLDVACCVFSEADTGRSLLELLRHRPALNSADAALAALEYHQARLSTRRHIDGRELALACRDLAIERYGVLARSVLAHWGIFRSADLGDVVFTLVDLGLLMSQASDTRLDFVDVFDFDGAFGNEYPWSTANLT